MEKFSNSVLIDNMAVTNARKVIWQQYIQKIKDDKKRLQETVDKVMEYGDVRMRYGLQIIGEPDENGFSLYIALHGGGQSDTPDMNDSQWNHMSVYYKEGIKNGIYVNPRGVRDTWDTHANPESYPLYDRLIENMILYYNADPTRVYLLGFSAGGDGVYMVAPRMADRFAAVNMSAGHPNGTSITNLYNTPIQLQVGELDTTYNRHTITAEYDSKLTALSELYSGGYIHNAYIHYQKGHNFFDNKLNDQMVISDNDAWLKDQEYKTTVTTDTNSVHFLDRYIRKSLPERIVWDLGNRAPLRKTTSFYWLRASHAVNEGEIIANFNKETNTITVEKETVNGDFSILLNEDMVDLYLPVMVITPKGSFTVKLEVSIDIIEATTDERGDANFQFAAEIIYSKLH